MPEVKIEEKKQKLLEQLSTGATYDPSYVENYLIDNFVKRVFSYLFGWNKDTGEPVKVKCMPDGSLVVVTTLTAVTTNEVRTGSATDIYTVLTAFSQVATSVDIFIWDNPAIIQRSIDGVTWQDEIEIPANVVYGFEAQTKQIRIKNKTAGAIARYQIIGWF